MLPDPPPYEQHHIQSITELPEGINRTNKYHTLVLMTDRQMFCSCQPYPIDQGPKFGLDFNLKTVPANQPSGVTYDPRYDTQLAIYAASDSNANKEK
jgi:hypothetical protein